MCSYGKHILKDSQSNQILTPFLSQEILDHSFYPKQHVNCSNGNLKFKCHEVIRFMYDTRHWSSILSKKSNRQQLWLYNMWSHLKDIARTYDHLSILQSYHHDNIWSRHKHNFLLTNQNIYFDSLIGAIYRSIHFFLLGPINPFLLAQTCTHFKFLGWIEPILIMPT